MDRFSLCMSPDHLWLHRQHIDVLSYLMALFGKMSFVDIIFLAHFAPVMNQLPVAHLCHVTDVCSSRGRYECGKDEKAWSDSKLRFYLRGV